MIVLIKRGEKEIEVLRINKQVRKKKTEKLTKWPRKLIYFIGIAPKFEK